MTFELLEFTISYEVLRTIFSGLTLISVMFVILNYLASRKKSRQDLQMANDKEICEQAIIALERAYEALTNDQDIGTPPKGSRINWLTSSRQIVRFNQLKSKLQTDLQKLIISEHEEYWRHKFYICLDHNIIMQETYYSSNNIHGKSALVIANFKQWESNKKDPLDTVDETELVEDGYTLKGLPGLESYVSTVST